MITTDCATDNIEHEYQWTIKNSAQALNSYTKFTWVMYFNLARVPGEILMYNLTLNFNGESVTWNLNAQPFSSSLKLTYRLSILQTDGQPIRTEYEFILGSKKSESKTIMTVRRIDLLSAAWNVCYNNRDLKVKFSLTICDKDTVIVPKTPTFTPKQHHAINDNFEELLKSENDSDVIFEVDGKEFKAHKLVLMARSPVFSTMFSIDMIEKETNRVKIVDISSSIFELFLHFIYTDRIMIKLDLETGIDLMKAASKYQLEGLEALCEAKLFQLLTPSNATKILLIAEKNHLDHFVETISNFIEENLGVVSSK